MGMTQGSFIVIVTCCLYLQGADFIDGSNKDGNGHGTHVAGQIKYIHNKAVRLFVALQVM